VEHFINVYYLLLCAAIAARVKCTLTNLMKNMAQALAAAKPKCYFNNWNNTLIANLFITL
jgi:hypothetical protein